MSKASDLVPQALLAAAPQGGSYNKEEEEMAAMTPCADCQHPAQMHADTQDGDDMGACSAKNCDCSAFVAKKTAAADAAALSLRFAGLGERTTATLTDFTFDVADTLPPAHKPGEKLPRRRATVPTPVMPPPAVLPTAGVRWSAVFAPEGRLTDDGRAFAPDSISWRTLPLTLMGMTVTSEGGHVGAEVCGRIDRIWRDDAAGLIRAEGIFDVGDYGSEIARLVADGTLRGVSVDLAIHASEVGPRSDWFDENGNWAPKAHSADEEPPSLVDILFGREGDASDPPVMVVTEAVIGMTTVCPFPAFADANIEIASALAAGGLPCVWRISTQAGWILTPRAAESPVVAACPVQGTGTHASVSGSRLAGLTASAAGLAPDAPPAAWFADPELAELTALTITDDGRILGHAWGWDTCHTGFPNSCTTAPHSRTGYAYFHLGEVLCDGGERVSVGKVTLDTPHADRGLGSADATAHYDHTGTVVAYVTVGEDAHGGWVAGALSPRADADKVVALRGAVLSGDWRSVDGNLELVALLAVNVPGFPVPRTRALVAAADGDDGEVVTLVAAGVVLPLEELGEDERLRFEALRARSDDRFAQLAARAA